ncbi:MAG: hypothetical protein ACKOAV_08210 [Bacteroidota bacterium]
MSIQVDQLSRLYGSQKAVDGLSFQIPGGQVVGLLGPREDSAHQYRFIKVVDPDNGRVLFEVEHEIRSMTHPLFMRPLVNRNAAITNNYYAAGNEAAVWAMPPA